MTDTRFKILLVVFYCLLQQLAIGQICNGSLGDPVVNITFGRGANPGPPLKASLPNLNYVNQACPDDGAYTIVNSSFNCFNSTWHSVSNNHTAGEPDGYMMLINASFNSGDFYIDTVKGLCGGTTYEFAAWVLNVLKSSACNGAGINPSLVFNIESTTGAVLGTYKTGNIQPSNSPAWQQYGLFFTTPAAAQNVVLRITNIAPGGCGNDLALDDITFRPCGPALNASVVGQATTTVDQCIDNLKPVTISSTLGAGFINPAYLWQRSVDSGQTWLVISGATGSSYTFLPAAPGNYRYRVAVAENASIGIKDCRIASNEILVAVHNLAGIGASINSPVCSNAFVQLNGGSGSIFNWTGPNGFTSNSKNPSFIAGTAQTGNYYLQANDAFGCAGKDTLFLKVNERPVAVLNDSATVCENESIILTAAGGTVYTWSPATGLSATNLAAPTASINASTSYTVVVGNSDGCMDTAAIYVKVVAAPKANAGPDQYISEGQSVVLKGEASGQNITYQWSPGSFMNNNKILTPTVSPPTDITYQLKVQSSSGCKEAVDEVFIRVYKKLIIPNAFSPNGDGINDTWKIEALFTYPEAAMTVFDRYGRVVFQSKGYNNEWDGTRGGKPLPIGTYYYLIDLKNTSPVLKGSVFITR